MKTSFLSHKVVKIALISSGLSFLVLFLSGCMSGDQLQAKAEQNFSVFLSRKNATISRNSQITSIGCSGDDSDKDGYVTCTGQNNSGKEFIYSCPYGRFWIDNKSCKADKVNTFDYNPSHK